MIVNDVIGQTVVVVRFVKAVNVVVNNVTCYQNAIVFIGDDVVNDSAAFQSILIILKMELLVIR